MSKIDDRLNLERLYLEFVHPQFSELRYKTRDDLFVLCRLLVESDIPARMGLQVLKIRIVVRDYPTIIGYLVNLGLNLFITLLDLILILFRFFSRKMPAFIKYLGRLDTLVEILRRWSGNGAGGAIHPFGRLSFNTLLLFARAATAPEQREFALGCMEERFEADRSTKGVLFALRKLAIDVFIAYIARIKQFVIKQVSRARKSI